MRYKRKCVHNLVCAYLSHTGSKAHLPFTAQKTATFPSWRQQYQKQMFLFSFCPICPFHPLFFKLSTARCLESRHSVHFNWWGEDNTILLSNLKLLSNDINSLGKESSMVYLIKSVMWPNDSPIYQGHCGSSSNSITYLHVNFITHKINTAILFTCTGLERIELNALYERPTTN